MSRWIEGTFDFCSKGILFEIFTFISFVLTIVIIHCMDVTLTNSVSKSLLCAFNYEILILIDRFLNTFETGDTWNKSLLNDRKPFFLHL